ncbi:hypothetical protein ACX0G9_11520 [Flavitalea flava]
MRKRIHARTNYYSKSTGSMLQKKSALFKWINFLSGFYVSSGSLPDSGDGGG